MKNIALVIIEGGSARPLFAAASRAEFTPTARFPRERRP
jgi:hypothetical protein